MKLTAKFARNYRSKKGNIVFTYLVNGTEKSLAAYEEAVGENIRHDEETGKPLFFTTRYSGDNVNLLITSNGRVVVDTSEFDKAASLASAYGGNLGQALASAAASQLLGRMGNIVPNAGSVADIKVIDDNQPAELESPAELSSDDLDA
jgi:hypothetical protein